MSPRRYVVAPRMGHVVDNITIGGKRDEDCLRIGSLAEGSPGVIAKINSSKEHVIGILGKRGSGKSYTLGKMIEGISDKSGEFNTSPDDSPAAICFDLMDIFWTSIYPLKESMEGAPGEQYELCKSLGMPLEGKFEIDVYAPAGFARDTDPTAIGEFSLPLDEFEIEDWQYLLDVKPNSPSGALVADAVISVQQGWEDTENNNHAGAQLSLEAMIEFIEDSLISNTNYQPQTIRAVTQRMVSWNNHELVSPSSFDVRSLLSSGKVSIFMLNRLPESVRFVVVSVIVRLLMRIRSHDSFVSKRQLIEPDWANEHEMTSRCWVLCDEAQLLVPRSRSNPAKSHLIRLVKEGRNFGTSFVFATQQPSAVDEEVLSQSDITICHQLSIERDIDDLLRYRKGQPPESIKSGQTTFEYQHLLRTLEPGQAIVSGLPIHQDDREVIVQIEPRVRVHGGFEA
jgi:DNA helicase HerA-like ATPase